MSRGPHCLKTSPISYYQGERARKSMVRHSRTCKETNIIAAARRELWRAGLLSLLLPGLGQVYNGQAKKGVLLYALNLIVGLALLPIMFGLSLAPVNIAGPILIILCLYLYVFCDAIRTARRLDHAYQLKAYNK